MGFYCCYYRLRCHHRQDLGLDYHLHHHQVDLAFSIHHLRHYLDLVDHLDHFHHHFHHHRCRQDCGRHRDIIHVHFNRADQPDHQIQGHRVLNSSDQMGLRVLNYPSLILPAFIVYVIDVIVQQYSYLVQHYFKYYQL